MPRTRYRIFEEEYPYFLTSSVVGWLPVFAHPQFAETILDAWRFLQTERGITLHGYVIMENHLHWIACGSDLSEHVGRFKSYTARRIIDDMRQSGFGGILGQLAGLKAEHKHDQAHQLWQEGNHPKQIQSRDMMVQKLQYMHNNPVRRGYVDEPEHWRYSSARNYAGEEGLIEIETEW